MSTSYDDHTQGVMTPRTRHGTRRKRSRTGEPSKETTHSHQKTAVNNPDCVICLETITAMESTCELACGHMFHSCCIQPWLLESKQCPICRSTNTSCTNCAEHHSETSQTVINHLHNRARGLENSIQTSDDRLLALEMSILHHVGSQLFNFDRMVFDLGTLEECKTPEAK
jgi:hypothetical protein